LLGACSAATSRSLLSDEESRSRRETIFAAYRKAGLLPKGQLHPLIASKVYPAFMRGEYDSSGVRLSVVHVLGDR
jgi:hypothetical protein